MTTQTAAPRIGALDLLRGVAIFGTFASNVWIFTHPAGPADVLSNAGGAASGSVAVVAETVLRWASNGKFLALLTIMFGVGVELQYRSAMRRGNPWPGRYLWRTTLLLVEGLLHYVLIFEFDVLMGYALVAFRVAYLVRRSDRAMRCWMWSVGAVHVAVLTGLTAVLLFAPGGGSAGGGTTTLYTDGSWWEQVVQRVLQAPVYRLELVLIVPSGIVLFLAGVRLFRAGVFEERGGALRKRLMAWGFGVGAPLNLLTSFGGGDWALFDRYVFPPVVALGLLGLVTEVALRSSGGVLRRWVSSVGRMALSCYVLQNLLGSALCYGWGLGLAARLDGFRPWWVVVAWAVVCAVLVLVSRWWLARFDKGPLEALWHWATMAPGRPRELERVGAGSA